LEKQGLKKQPGDSHDLLVKYWAEKNEKRMVSGTTGSGPGAKGGATVHDYTEGTLILDLIEAKSNSLAWRATLKGVLSQDPKDNEKMVKEAVADAFKKYPPKK
jgi:hypothetical protein